MLRLLLTLVFLGALATSAGPSKTCTACSLLGECREIPCPSDQDSCLFNQIQLEDGHLIQNGSCVARQKCQENIYALTYAPNMTLWASAACCDNNCSRFTQPEPRPEAQLNGVQCHYCFGDQLAQCDSFPVLNCTGYQNVCATLEGTWIDGVREVLRGCATPSLCDLPVNTTLGPEASGFHLTSPPECNHKAPPTPPDSHATPTHAEAKATTCFTCSDNDYCEPFSCPTDRKYCLQTAGILALGVGNLIAWRNGSCVASKDCKFDSSISALTYSNRFGFWVNTTCCQGDCQKLPLLASLPVPRNRSRFLCPTCANGRLGLCTSSLYMQCPHGETECVRLDLVSEEGGRNLSVSGCGSRDLCGASALTEGLRVPLGPGLAGRFHCSSRQRAVIGSKYRSGAAPGLRLALPPLVAALVAATLS